jgi:uncharacterized repeat protein (TIGR02543 family)
MSGEYKLYIEYDQEHAYIQYNEKASYQVNEIIEAIVIPMKEFEFIGWYIDDALVNLDTEYTFPMPSHNLTLTAKFAIKDDLVQLSVSNSEGGVVELSSVEPKAGSSITAIATPSEIYAFVGWYDGDTLMSEETNYTFIVPTLPLVLEAKFIRSLFKLTTIIETPESTTSEFKYYSEDASIDIDVQDNEYYQFTGWKTEDSTLVSENLTDVFTMPGLDTTIIAKFVAIDVNLSVLTSNSDRGHVTNFIDPVKSGTVITLNAIPSLKCIFTGWYSEDEKIFDIATYSFKIKKQNLEITAQFERVYTFAASIDTSGGSISGTVGGDYLAGTSISVSANVASNFDFGGWYRSGAKFGENLTHSFEMPAEDIVIKAEVARIYNYTLTSYNTGMGVINGENSGTFSKLRPVCLNVDAAPGYVFHGWYTDKKVESSEIGYTLQNQTEDVNLIARFNMDGLTFIARNGTYYFDQYTGNLTSYIFPDMYQGNQIADFDRWTSAFRDRTLDIMVLPPLAYNLDARSAYLFSNSIIEKVIVSEGTLNIGLEFFRNSTVGSIQLPESLIKIDNNAFMNCKIAAIELPENLETIGSYAFADNTIITSIIIPEKVKIIEHDTFRSSTKLTDVTFKGDVEIIGGSAFMYCSSLTNITLPNSVKTIESLAFYDCTSLTSITIPNSVTSMEKSTFQGCRKLESIEFNAQIDTIPNSMFISCISLTSISLPLSVKYIMYNAFENCKKLAYISNLTEVIFIDSCAFQYSGIVSLELPNVTTIGKEAFRQCTKLEQITLGSVTTIKNSAFIDCTTLKSIILPGTLQSIEQNAFKNCTSLESIIIGEGIKKLSSGVFYDCSAIKRFYIPASFTEFSVSPFGGSSSTSYDYVEFLATEVNSLPAYFPATSIGALVLAANIDSITPTNLTITNIFSLNTDTNKVEDFKSNYNKANTNFYTYSEERREGDYWCYLGGIATKWSDIEEP